MPDIKALVERVSGALGQDADPAHIEEVVSALLSTGTRQMPFIGATLHVSLSDCSSLLANTVRSRVYDKIRRVGSHLDVALHGTGIGTERRIATTPITTVAGRSAGSDLVLLARMLDDAARDCGVTEISGFGARADYGMGTAAAAFVGVIPEALHATERVVVDVLAASKVNGVNADAVRDVVSALRRYDAAPEELLRVRLSAGSPSDDLPVDAALYLRADAAAMTAEALRSAPDAPVHDLCDVLVAASFVLGRQAAQKAEDAAALLRARSGLDVRYGGVDVLPGLGKHGDALLGACAEAVVRGFRAAARASSLLPRRRAVAVVRSSTDEAVTALLADTLWTSLPGSLDLHLLYADGRAGTVLNVGPFQDVPIQEPAPAEWIRRGGRITFGGADS